jgi:UDP-GlcNAc:undecaprenyl-phosphate GlcNAc-1-phosphate transferase
MSLIFGLLAGIFLTLVLIPPLTRVSAWCGLQDLPGERKVHRVPIPRVGGIAIGCATLTSIVVWVPLETEVRSYVIGGIWILFFGIIDDIFELRAKWKLLAQLPAVAIALSGGIVQTHLPFFGFDAAPAWIIYPVSAIFLLGTINAINLFDGLDGLAGGCVLLSLGAIALLAFQVEGFGLALMALALMGALLGFLNFNTHPARIFLGDAGSQGLGFSLAVFAIMLAENVHTALNPTIPFMILGLPLLDTCWVFFRRVSEGRSPFAADKQHLHHLLLSGGFSHSQAVSIIYAFQSLVISSVLVLRYASDTTVVSIYLIECAAFLFLVVRRARHSGAEKLKDRHQQRHFSGTRERLLRRFSGLRKPLCDLLEGALGLFVIASAIFGPTVARDVAIPSLVLAVLVPAAALFFSPSASFLSRTGFYVVSLLAIFACQSLLEVSVFHAWIVQGYMGVIALILVLSVVLTPRQTFQATPQDFLIGFFAVSAPVLPNEWFADLPLGFMVISAISLFYAFEYVFSIEERRNLVLRVSIVASLMIFGIRGVAG